MIDELRSGPLFASLNEEQLLRVGRHALRVKLNRGQLLFSQGDPANRFYLVLEGRVRLFRLSPDGAEKVIEIIGPGQTFAEALMFLNEPRYPVCAAALSPARLIGIDAADFAKMLRESVDTCLLLLGDLSRRLRGLIGEIDNLALHTATSRVARYLMQKLRAGRCDLDLDVRKSVLASRLSVKPETFSRVIKQLGEQGVIEVNGSHFRILDRETLARVAELGEGVEAPAPPRASTGSDRR